MLLALCMEVLFNTTQGITSKDTTYNFNIQVIEPENIFNRYALGNTGMNITDKRQIINFLPSVTSGMISCEYFIRAEAEYDSLIPMFKNPILEMPLSITHQSNEQLTQSVNQFHQQFDQNLNQLNGVVDNNYPEAPNMSMVNPAPQVGNQNQYPVQNEPQMFNNAMTDQGYTQPPPDNEYPPKGIVSGGLVLRYNFVGKRMPTNKALYYNTLAEQQEMKDAYERQLQDKQRENDGLQSKLRKSQQENADLKALVEDCQNANAKVNGHDVYFPVNKTKIIEQERIRLNDFIASLKEQKNYKLTIIGEASSDGPSSKNFKLSEGRLNNVVDYLKKKGIEDFSIKLEKAVGDSNGCPDIKCRRVQITVE